MCFFFFFWGNAKHQHFYKYLKRMTSQCRWGKRKGDKKRCVHTLLCHCISVKTSGLSLKQMLLMPSPEPPCIFCQLLQVLLLMTHTVAFSGGVPLRNGSFSPGGAYQLYKHSSPPTEQLRANHWQRPLPYIQVGQTLTVCFPELPLGSGWG